MALLEPFLVSFIAALVTVSIAFIVALIRDRRFDIIDVAWGLLFVAIAWTNVVVYDGNAIGIIVTIMVTLWSVRLSSHILRRWLGSSHEDRRYVEIRQKWPSALPTLQMFVRIYLLQAALACLVALPIIGVIQSQRSFAAPVVVGILVWATGFMFESVADRQLRRFISRPKNNGKLMTKGLWAYSRHPNYFGEILLWWGIAIMGIGTEFAVLGFMGAITISGLIIFVSGIPPSEGGMKTKAGWAEYKKQTPVLVPLPKR